MEDRTARNIGLALALLGLILNPWFIGTALLPRGRVETGTSVDFILLGDLFCLAGGLWFFFKRKKLNRKSALFSLVILVMIPLGIEGGLQLFKLVQTRVWGQGLDSRLPMSCFRDRQWAPELLKEQHALVMSFEQYLGWQTEEYHGRYVNVESDGTRRTINSAPDDMGSGLGIYMFGGSTMWGTYARDSCTLPSLLSLKCTRGGVRVNVSNFGQPGFNFTQGVIQLTLLLRQGKRPDVAVFYEGFNDIGAARAFGHAGETSLSPEFNEMIDVRRSGFLKQVGFAAGEAIRRGSMLYRSVTGALELVREDPSREKPVMDPGGGAIDSLGRAIAREYRLNFELLDSLSRIYGFKYACVLQPGLFTKATISREEETVDPRLNDSRLRSLFLTTYARFREGHFTRLYDFTPVFDAHDETVYLDVCHVSEEGNAILADSLIQILRQ